MNDSTPEQQEKQKAHSADLKQQAVLQKTYSLSQTEARAFLKNFRAERKLAEMSRIAVSNQAHETAKIQTTVTKQEMKRQDVQNAGENQIAPPPAVDSSFGTKTFWQMESGVIKQYDFDAKLH